MKPEDRKMIVYEHNGVKEFVDNQLIELYEMGEWKECEACDLLQCCCMETEWASAECATTGDKIEGIDWDEYRKWQKDTNRDRLIEHFKKVDKIFKKINKVK